MNQRLAMGRRSRCDGQHKQYTAPPTPDGVEPLGDYLLREVRPPTYWEMVDVPDDEAQQILAKVGHAARAAMGAWVREAGELYWEDYQRDPSRWSDVAEHGVMVGNFARPWWRAHGMRDLHQAGAPTRLALSQRHAQEGVAHVKGLLAQILASSPGGKMGVSAALMELIWYAVPHPLHHPGQYMAHEWGPTGDAVWAINSDEVEDSIRRRLAAAQARAQQEGVPFDADWHEKSSAYLRRRTHSYVVDPSVGEIASNLCVVPPWQATAVRNREIWASPAWVPTPMATWWARQCLGALTTWIGSTPGPSRVHELFAQLEKIYADVNQDPVPWAVLHVRANRSASDVGDAQALWCWSRLFEWLAGPDLTQNPWAREIALRSCLMAGPAGAPCPQGSFVPDESAWYARVHALLDGTGASIRPRQPDDPEECYDLVLCVDGVPVPGPARKAKDPSRLYDPPYTPHCALSVRRLMWETPGASVGPLLKLSFFSRHGHASIDRHISGPWYQHILRTWGARSADYKHQCSGVYKPHIIPDMGYRVLRTVPTWGYELS